MKDISVIDQICDSVKKDNYSYWFTRIKASNEFKVLKIENEYEVVGRLDSSHPKESLVLYDSIYESDRTIILEDFANYKMNSPEYLLGHSEIDKLCESEELEYANLLAACFSIKYSDRPVSLLKSCLEWIDTTDFYACPASTRFHDSEPGGLLHHTLSVVRHCWSLLRIPEFSSVNIADITLVALVHDWCKIGLYESYMRNSKNDVTGQWEKVPSYRVKSEPFMNLGHGVSSLFLAQKFFKFTLEESCAIRWHMGRWRVSEEELNELQFCNEMWPMVHLIQFADQLSITEYGRYENE